jgi:hypothetical protein
MGAAGEGFKSIIATGDDHAHAKGASVVMAKAAGFLRQLSPALRLALRAGGRKHFHQLFGRSSAETICRIPSVRSVSYTILP